ncbi:hypothetical protein P1X14_07070 [Sphingomonas sp. AOB5]|uniref:hypothetical protein n=1 Tax=Sphingomonas sp. AOB5 TaxID=3034017 RepID=UPI0023FA1A17|nr:hypothetical protein [Sphingomonas sp. AOB5]MDF7775000.1 hypothetical protein [Sphingomonas sp. AOB5]
MIALLALMLAAAPTQDLTTPPQRTGECRWVRGRMSGYNGNPTLRIWIVGTNRMLGVRGDGDQPDEAAPRVLRATFDRMRGDAFTPDLWADFRVCALAPSRLGYQQPVWVTGYRRLVIAERNHRGYGGAR